MAFRFGRSSSASALTSTSSSASTAVSSISSSSLASASARASWSSETFSVRRPVRVREWRALHGPPKEVFFAQAHRPGEAFQTDFTVCNALKITIAGETFPHMLCHVALPHSNWSWATVCMSESLLALRRGVQTTLLLLGRRAEFHQTDNSTAATHRISADSAARGFNDDYMALMKHFGMTPRTIAVGRKEQNGDIESLHGVLKRRLEQHLLLRRSRDFESIEDYEQWVQSVMLRANAGRSKRVAEELAVMEPVTASALPEFVEFDARVSRGSTVRVKDKVYSVPSRLSRETVTTRSGRNTPARQCCRRDPTSPRTKPRSNGASSWPSAGFSHGSGTRISSPWPLSTSASRFCWTSSTTARCAATAT